MKRIQIDLDSPQWKRHWALVTGASSGIGLEFCRQLAAKGLNLVLVARRTERLQALARELEEAHGVEAKAIGLDLAQPGAAAKLRQNLEALGLSIRLLVNNAAFGRWGHFEATASTLYQDMLQVNVIAPTTLCREFLPHLSRHDGAAVIMVSSPAALQPVPYMAGYAAAKAYVHAFGQALHGEWAGRGILVQTLVPGPTATEFDSVAGAYTSALQERGNPVDVVKASLQGLASGKVIVWQAKGVFKQRLLSLLPAGVVIRQVARMFLPPDQKT